MADVPKWTSDPQYFSSTRWIWRRETTTITWWPHIHGDRASQSATLGDPKHTQARTDQKHADWNCGCGTNNWPWRQECFVCYAPRSTSDHIDAKTFDRAEPDNATTNTEKPAAGTHNTGSAAKRSENAEDPPPKEGQ